jgi:acetyltransferase-like isoleucine patch superfamily enzyme
VTKIEKAIRGLRAALRLRGHLKRYAFVGPGVSVNIAVGAICEIGDRASIGRGCGIAVGRGARLRSGDHTTSSPIRASTPLPVSRSVATASFPGTSTSSTTISIRWFRLGGVGGSQRAPIRIGDRVWIGTGVKVLKGVTIGEDSVVAAGAVVTKAFPPRSLIGGVPARRIAEIAGWR